MCIPLPIVGYRLTVMTAPTHITVLLQETIDALQLSPGDTVFDGTFGGGGHSNRIADIIGPSGTLISLDRDQSVFNDATVAGLKQKCQFHFAVENFRYLEKVLNRFGAGMLLDGAVLDLGLSSTQLDVSGRGFSFLRNEPLQMTFAESDKEMNAEVVVNEWSEDTLRTILLGFGEERFASRIAKGIVLAREEKRITTTTELVEIVKRSTPLWYHAKRIHPATLTFQAIRMAVNGELDAVNEGLPKVIEFLKPGKRASIISFHSIEDRAVKYVIKEQAEAGKIKLVNKKPIVPSDEELSKNPRARSAKLRIIEKL